ncbi:MAG: class I SAM-dependent methyltransferase [Culturomica sp.]|jgi:SAM-dependent methyltransferase|nr:class I SAM-dependent methyltransferase [Culturomica sp.]
MPYGFVVIYNNSKHSVIKGRLRESNERNKGKKSFEELQGEKASVTFANIYKSGYWTGSDKNDESMSGEGSFLKNTTVIRKALPKIWSKFDIKSFLDVPCGDYNWMKVVDKTGIEYIGGDIVDDVVKANNAQYQCDNVHFETIDITKDKLPKTDMIFCKDCIQHLSYKSVNRALKNFANSGAKYLLITSYPYTLQNWDIIDGDYRPLNLLVEPFCLPEPILRIHKKHLTGVEPDKMMFLYKIDGIKEQVNEL